jgi:hypothetical protein
MRLFMVRQYVNVIYLTAVFNTVFDDAVATDGITARGCRRRFETWVGRARSLRNAPEKLPFRYLRRRKRRVATAVPIVSRCIYDSIKKIRGIVRIAIRPGSVKQTPSIHEQTQYTYTRHNTRTL